MAVRRIAVIGSPGAGKSTLARELGAVLGLPVFHLDRLLWRPGWTQVARAEQAAIQQDLVRQDAWIIDGNWGSTMDIRLAAADAVIFLDLPGWLCLWRAVRRRFQFAGRERPDMAPECPEKLDGEFLTFIWTFAQRERPKIEARLKALASGKPVVRLQTPRAVQRFLARARTTGPFA